MEISEIAKGKLKEILNNNPGKNLRIVIQGFGWGGPQLGMALDEPNANEAATLVNGIEVLIADEVKDHAEGRTIDYISDPYQEGFTIGHKRDTCCWYTLRDFNLEDDLTESRSWQEAHLSFKKPGWNDEIMITKKRKIYFYIIFGLVVCLFALSTCDYVKSGTCPASGGPATKTSVIFNSDSITTL